MLINEAKEQYISFPLFTNDDIVIVTDAGVLDCKFCNIAIIYNGDHEGFVLFEP